MGRERIEEEQGGRRRETMEERKGAGK